jgi:hypothetical protein
VLRWVKIPAPPVAGCKSLPTLNKSEVNMVNALFITGDGAGYRVDIEELQYDEAFPEREGYKYKQVLLHRTSTYRIYIERSLWGAHEHIITKVLHDQAKELIEFEKTKEYVLKMGVA